MAPNTEVQKTVIMDMGALLDAEDGAIVTLVAGDTRLVVHRAVLTAASPVFEAMFGHNMLEASSCQVTIPDVEGPVLRQLLAFIYTHRAPQLPGMAAQLLAAADKYGLPSLKVQCEEHMVAQLGVENAAAAAVLAVRHSCTSLKQAAVTFIKDHNFQVMATQGWADAVRTQPEDVVEVSRQLAEPPVDNSVPSAASCRTNPSPHDQPHSWTQVAAMLAATLLTATGHTHPLEGAAVSQMLSLSTEEKHRRLIQAAQEGKINKLRMLLAAGAEVGARGVGRETALHFAAIRGDVEVARYLLENGAEVGAKDRCRNTPLHWAAEHGHTAVVQLLVAFSADPNARGWEGMTPLHYAASCGHPETVTVLLAAGANRGSRANRGNTPLVLARRNSQQQVIDRLLVM